MKQLDDLLEMWRADSVIDRTEPGKALINIPQLHSKYLNILSRHRLLSKEAEFKYNKMKKLKWEYYTGKLDKDQLEKYNWQPFPFVLKSDITTYLESDDDINKHIAQKIIHDEIVDVCQSILKELNNRAWELKSFIDWEKFIQGI
jgi:hypothetical protein